MKRQKLYISTIDEHAHLLARQYGLGLEIAEFCTAMNLDELFPEKDALVRSKLPYASRFVLHGPFSELFPCAVDPLIREVAKKRYTQAIQTALSYGITKLVFHGGFDRHLYFPCWYTEQSVLFWRDFLRTVPENVEICLENVLEETPEMLSDIIRQVNSPRLRMCLDVGHANAYSKASPMTWLEQSADCIDHFHIHNNDASFDTHSALDCGTIPIPALLKKIDSLCPQATMTLELMDAAPSIRFLEQEDLLEEE